MKANLVNGKKPIVAYGPLSHISRGRPVLYINGVKAGELAAFPKLVPCGECKAGAGEEQKP